MIAGISVDNDALNGLQSALKVRVPVSVRHVAIGESNQELAKRNLCIFANLAKLIK